MQQPLEKGKFHLHVFAHCAAANNGQQQCEHKPEAAKENCSTHVCVGGGGGHGCEPGHEYTHKKSISKVFGLGLNGKYILVTQLPNLVKYGELW